LVHVTKQKGESDEKLINRFRKKVLISGLVPEFKEKDRYEKKSEKRKKKKYLQEFRKYLEKKRGN